ncbi:MAG: hypothetical protein JST42_22100 [Bacteroidetes bacterium]|nr:hypothetical protein [Bacteroidota bacterium]
MIPRRLILPFSVVDGMFRRCAAPPGPAIFPLHFLRTAIAQTAPFRKGMQIDETSYICFGYRFFEQYKTVWYYAEKKIYILEK